jgi:hypothetical protein
MAEFDIVDPDCPAAAGHLASILIRAVEWSCSQYEWQCSTAISSFITWKNLQSRTKSAVVYQNFLHPACDLFTGIISWIYTFCRQDFMMTINTGRYAGS